MQGLQNNDSTIKLLKNIISTFEYWPRIGQLLWKTDSKYFLYIIFLTVCLGISPIFSLLAISNLINDISASTKEPMNTVVMSLVFLIAITFFREIIQIYFGFIQKLFETKLVIHMSSLVMEKILELSLSDFENADIQDQIKRAQKEGGHRPYQIFQQIIEIITSLITVISAVTILIVWNWWVTFIIICISCLTFLGLIKQIQLEFTVDWNRASRERESWYLSYLLIFENAFREIKLYKLGQYFITRFQSILQGFYQEDVALGKKRLKILLIIHLLNHAVLAGSMFLVIWSAYQGEILIGTVIALLQAIILIQATTHGIMQGVLDLCHDNLFLEQLFQFLNFKSSDDNRKGGLTFGECCQLEFRNVSFRYPESDQYAVKNLNFSIKHGETLAIVGKNGSGKSTIVKLLAQLYTEYEGEILINGVPLKLIDIDFWRKNIGIVFQDFVRYEMPVRQNIGFGDIEKMFDDRKLKYAIEQAGVEGLFEKMSLHYHSQLGSWFEDSVQLSGGQWQKIAIARAFFREAQIFIFDEPSSFLDPEAEKDVFDKFRELAKNRLGVFVSHRYSSVRFADKILVMDQGSMIEFGEHDELMEKNGIYAELYNMQLESYHYDSREKIKA